MRDAFIAKLTEIARKDPKILLVTGDLGYGVLDNFRKELPEQFINAGIAEQNMMSMSTGLAMEGYRVFVYSIANFTSLRCLEQIRNDACYHDANVTVVSVGGGFSYGALGMSHHATEDLSILRSFPMGIFAPCDLKEVEYITEHLTQTRGTNYLRLDKSYADIERDFSKYSVSEIQKIRDGSDICLIVCGGICKDVITAADILKEQHQLTSSIYTVPDLNRVDFSNWLNTIGKYKAVLTVEENTINGGLGSLVSEKWLESNAPKVPFKRIGMRDGFSAVVGSQEYLKKYYKMDFSAIVENVLKMIK